jgi:DNA transposition AAA+ family ATPase
MNSNSHPEPDERQSAPKIKKLHPCDEALRAELIALRDSNPKVWTPQAFAAATGYSVTVFHLYLDAQGNVYSGDTKAVEAKVAEFLRDQRLALDTSVDTIDWDGARQIADAIEDIRTAKRIGVVIAPPGFGKTRGIDLYCQSHTLAIPLHVWSGECNKSSVVSCLFRAAGIARSGKGENEAQTLARVLKDTTRTGLIDDAHKLTCQSLQLLYDLRDQTGMPFVLFGDNRLIAKLRNDPQRLRRTGVVYQLKLRNPEKLIDHHLRQILPGELDGELVALRKLCLQIAEQAGHFGSVQMELALAVRLKQGAPQWSWVECVKAAHTRLIRDYALTN